LADIFISYSQADRDQVVMLAAYLESEGWIVWWDKNLNPGEPYRDEIMKQLVAARAVIVLWTQTSIKSDFVRAEAGRAKADGKLIPVKVSNVAYGDIPLPFGEMHTENLSNRELIRAAVVAQLATPQVQPHAWWVASRTLRYQVLTWIGVLGGAITLFANLREVLNLAEWARWLVENWNDLTAGFWRIVLSWTGIQLPKRWVPILSFGMFGLVTALGARRRPKLISTEHPVQIKRYTAWVCIFYLAIITMASFEPLFPEDLVIWAVVSLLCFGPSLVAVLSTKGSARFGFASLYFCFLVVLFLIPLGSDSGQLPLGDALSYVHAVINTLGIDIDDSSKHAIERTVLTTLVTLLCFGLPVLMLIMAPLRAIVERLLFLLVGLILLIALNQLSHYAPDIRALLKPPA
jgi:TIR domain-containing protein